MTIKELKRNLAVVFDDNTKTVIYKNYLDYTIWSFILISTIGIFLSTYNSINERYGEFISFIDIVTTIFFTIEVSLRIWTIDELEPKYKGFWGRVRYCLTFYGLVDFISTYAFYAGFFIKLPVPLLKALRVVRLLRVFRFMKSFRILTAAVTNKGKEMLVSFQFLIVITVILSFVLFYTENEAQPDVYNNGLIPVLWAFMQYIGDPGGFGDYPPVTIIGRIISCIVGVLGIAIFAVPAGLIGSGFTDEMEKDERNEKNKANEEKILTSFFYAKDKETGLFYVPRYKRIHWLQTRMGVSQNEIIEAVASSSILRIKDIGEAQPVSEPVITELIVETFPANRPYGCCIDRGSNITIVATTSATEPSGGNFCFYLAKLGGFNYVSKEYDQNPVRMTSFYNIEKYKDEAGNTCYLDPNIALFLDDLRRLSSRPKSVVIPIIVADARITGDNPKDEQFHFHIGLGKNLDGKPNYQCEGLILKPETIATFDAMYNDFSATVYGKYGYKCDVQKYGALIKDKNVIYHLHNDATAFCIRVACSIATWNNKYVAVTQVMADLFAKHFSPDHYPLVVPEDMKSPDRVKKNDYGFGFYTDIVAEKE